MRNDDMECPTPTIRRHARRAETARRRAVSAVLLLALPTPAIAQGLSELYAAQQDQQQLIVRPDPLVAAPGMQSDMRRLSPSVSATSMFAVSRPAPRTYGLHDLVTIIIREDLNTDFSAEVESSKELNYDGGVREFPSLKLNDLLDLQLKPQIINPELQVRLDFAREFQGEADYSRRETMTARLQARVVDVKPNGTLVLEARKHLQSDDETVTLVVTGTCRVDDITLDNTILSSQLYDLHASKDHEGELRRSTRKGPFTKLLDSLFAF